MTAVQDAAVRQRALDPQRSFIVQAPAGSGKTELLTQRFLALLGVAERPESILAMTFTRKAASEMRERILQQLREAAAHPVASPDWPQHRQHSWQLARTALDRDSARGWQLLAHPARLRIHTIDAFCGSLVLQMPYLSRLGGMARTADDPLPLYHEAARATLRELDGDAGELAEALFLVLGQLDNRRDRLQQLIADMLARREQWLRHIVAAGRDESDDSAFRADLEAAIQGLALHDLGLLLDRHAAADWLEPLHDSWQTACAWFREADIDHPVLAIEAWPDWSRPDLGLLAPLRSLAQWLLTEGGQGHWRKIGGITRKQGFPTEKDWPGHGIKAAKERFGQLLEHLAAQDGLDEALRALMRLPATAIPESEWAFFRALRRILRHALGELALVFAEQGQLDFSAVNLSALQALGDEDDPTDLAIRKDQQIHHILVDEFQDTSHSQFELLRRLMREWQPDEGRTVFLVGDPMQSIYRFREADVGLFLRVREHGFGRAGEPAAWRPEFLELTANFRSDAGIVDWVNAHFSRVFASEEDMALGAIRYAPSTATRAAAVVNPVCLHPAVDDDGSAEAETVAAIVLAHLPALPAGDSIAILVRARSHLAAIAAALHRHGLPFQAVDIEPLADKQTVEDLLALTRALLHPADREAWLACLRAPWCGLRLAELERLMQGQPATATVWECLQHTAPWPAFSADSQARLSVFMAVMQRARLARSRQPLRQCVEAAWLALGGPATLLEASGFDDAEAFLRLLENLAASAADVAEELPEALQKLYAAPSTHPAAPRIQLMTVHASKGLQFDTVILPGLHRVGRRDDRRLLHWQQFTLNEREALLMAPLEGNGTADSSGLYAFLNDFEQRKADHELRRLGYVAATRARNHLHLLGSVRRDRDGAVQPPRPQSLLGLLWPSLAPAFGDLPPAEAATGIDDCGFVPKTARLRPQWALPQLPPEPVASPPQRPVLEPYQGAAQEDGRSVGQLVHAYLALIHREGVAHWSRDRVLALAPVIGQRLRAEGLAPRRIDRAASRVMNALIGMLDDATGRWLLDNRHEDSQAELELYAIEAAATTTHVVDRTFIADGVRWIVDYKTTEPARGQSLEAFLAAQQAEHRAQLQRYADLFARCESLPRQLMLYFPLLPAELRWRPEPAADR